MPAASRPRLRGNLNGLLPLTAMFATPLFGLLADRIGKRALLMALGSALLLPVFLLLTYTKLPIGLPVAMMGISFSLIPAVMWPSVAYLVDEKKLGTAYALMTLCQQIGLGDRQLGDRRAERPVPCQRAEPGRVRGRHVALLRARLPRPLLLLAPPPAREGPRGPRPRDDHDRQRADVARLKSHVRPLATPWQGPGRMTGPPSVTEVGRLVRDALGTSPSTATGMLVIPCSQASIGLFHLTGHVPGMTTRAATGTPSFSAGSKT